MTALLTRSPKQVPLPGSTINWGHPLARGLSRCWIFNAPGAVVQDLAAGNIHGERNDLTVLASDIIPAYPGGLAHDQRGTSNPILIGDDSAYRTVGSEPMTLLVRGAVTASTGQQPFTASQTSGNSFNSGYGLRVNTYNNNNRHFYAASNLWGESGLISDSGLVPQDRVIRQYALSRVPANGWNKLFFEGIEVATNSSTGSLGEGSTTVYIGRWANGWTHLTGRIESIMLWRGYAKTAEEMRWLADEPYAFMAEPCPIRSYFFTAAGAPASAPLTGKRRWGLGF